MSHCYRYDFCLYLSGTTDEGEYVKYQGCSEDFDAEYDTDGATCTYNRYTREVHNGKTDILQCCDTNNCNTGNGANQIYTVFSLIMIFCCKMLCHIRHTYKKLK
uniref:UPAR/Ly6 domain-containing protein n=1 Tax=Panagrolaimus sp. PS1159 TaxID=55785 RepID=A0AC35FNS3_9BILA